MSRNFLSGLQTNGLIVGAVIKTAPYTANTSDIIILANGTFTVTLPTPVGATGRFYTVKNTGTGTVTVATTAGTIDGGATAVITVQYSSIDVVSDGTNWNII